MVELSGELCRLAVPVKPTANFGYPTGRVVTRILLAG